MASLVKWLHFAGARTVTGDPVASGTVAFYEPGSTTVEVTVYADAAETTPLAQPVDLNAAGQAEVYIKTPAEIIVKDADGVQVKLSTRGESVDAGEVDCEWSSAASDLRTVLAAIEALLTAAASDVPADTIHAETIATINPSFEFNELKTINYFHGSYADTSATFTVTWPSPAPTLVRGTRYRIIIHGNDVGGGATSATSMVFPAEMLTKTPPTTILTGTVYLADFVATAGSKLLQVTPWNAVAADGF